jgi:hypothetical protein
MMTHQRKKVFGMIFFALLITTVFLMKNTVGATIDTLGNTITGANINISNANNYDVNLQFSGTLDAGDIATIELIDITANSISGTYIGIGWETGIIMNFNTAGLTGGIFTLSGNVVDSW